jgi:hypothetical protein
MADKPEAKYARKYRVLKDFKDLAGKEHKADDEIELLPKDAEPLINSDKITSELATPNKESEEPE